MTLKVAGRVYSLVVIAALPVTSQDRGNYVEVCRDIPIAPSVIPAKAGIQWFMSYIPA